MNLRLSLIYRYSCLLLKNSAPHYYRFLDYFQVARSWDWKETWAVLIMQAQSDYLCKYPSYLIFSFFFPDLLFTIFKHFWQDSWKIVWIVISVIIAVSFLNKWSISFISNSSIHVICFIREIWIIFLVLL